MKNSVKALGKTNFTGFQCFIEKFPNISATKMKERIFVVPKIKEVLQDEGFEESLNVLN